MGELDSFFMLLGLFALLVPIGAILGIIAFRRTSALRRDLMALRGTLTALRVELAELQSAAVTPPEAAPAAPTPEPQPETPAMAQVADEPVPPEPVAAGEGIEAPAADAPIPEPALAQAAAPKGRRIEQNLTGRWTVWLGGLVLALGGVFLVKYSIEEGLFGPGLRVIAGLLLGIGLVVAAIRLRRTGAAARAASGASPDYVPASLTAAGVAMLFATIYAAYALYFFIPPILAFAALAGVAAIAVLLSLLFGQFIALLGLAGAFLVPLLVTTNAPSAIGLFGYLFIVALGALALVRYRGWWWLAHATLALSALWTIVWFGMLNPSGDDVVLSLYLALLAAAFIFTARTAALPDRVAANEIDPQQLLVWTASGTIGVLIVMLATADHAAVATLIAAIAVSTLFLDAGHADAAFDRLSWVAALLVSGVIASWTVAIDPQLFPLLPNHPAIPADATRLFIAAACFAAFFGLSGFVLQWDAAHPGRWAAAAAAVPVAMLALLYWRLAHVASDTNWTLIGIALAGVYLAAARETGKQRGRTGMEVALAAYAIGVIAALALAATMALQRAWLSVALALMLPGIAWVGEKTRVAAVRWVALVIAVVVLARLLINPSLLDYPIGGTIFNWILYGYGIPAIAFAVAAYLFRRGASDLLTQILEGGALALTLTLVSLELHQWFGGGTLVSGQYTFLEASLQSDAWLLAALFRLYRARNDRRLLQVWSWRIVGGAALLHLVLYLVIAANPLWSDESVGETPIFNDLLLAYGVPALIAVPFLNEARRQGENLTALIAGIAAALLGFITVSLEVRQWFQGGVLSTDDFSDAEGYAYSLAWLAYGGVLLGLGVWRDRLELRLAGLAFLTLTVGKAFLFDMANLAGLYRAASFLGLGLSLIGIGYLYQRLASIKPVAPPPSPS